MDPIAIFIALAAVLTAVAFFLSSRMARQKAATREKEVGDLRVEVETARKELAATRSEIKERREEVASLRNDLRDTKKKAFDQAEAAKKLGGAVALREEIDKLSARLAEVRAEAAHGSARVKALEAQLAKAGQELQKATLELEKARTEAAQRQAEAAAVASPTTPAVDLQNLADLQKDLAAERDRADKAEARLGEARKRVVDLEKDVKNVRGRLETEKRVYIVQKGELDLAADRYAELKRRNDALRRDHEELVEAVRQAAREDRRLSEEEKHKARSASEAGSETALRQMNPGR